MGKRDEQLYGECECGNIQELKNSDNSRTCLVCGKRIRKLSIGFTATVSVDASMKAKMKRIGFPGSRKVRREIESGKVPKRDGSGGFVDKYLDRDRDKNWYTEIIDGIIIRNKPLSQHKGHGIDEKKKKSR